MVSNYSSSTASLATPTYSVSSFTEPLGLPGDEYRILKGRQDRDRLEAHFAHRGSGSNPRSSTAYQQAGMSKHERTNISELRSATRRALGESFDFTDKSFDKFQRAVKHHPDAFEEDFDQPIPQRYIDEYHSRSREDCRKYDNDQDMEDCTSGAAWVLCDPSDRDVAANSSTLWHQPSMSYVQSSNKSYSLGWIDSVMGGSYKQQLPSPYEPQLVSKFSFDSDMPKKRKIFGRQI